MTRYAPGQMPMPGPKPGGPGLSKPQGANLPRHPMGAATGAYPGAAPSPLQGMNLPLLGQVGGQQQPTATPTQAPTPYTTPRRAQGPIQPQFDRPWVPGGRRWGGM